MSHKNTHVLWPVISISRLSLLSSFLVFALLPAAFAVEACQHSCLIPDSKGDVTVETVKTGFDPPKNDLQQVFVAHGFSFNVTTDQKQYQRWNFTSGASANVTLRIKHIGSFAAYTNVFGYYVNGSLATFVPVYKTVGFAGRDHPIYSAAPNFTENQSVIITIPAGTHVGFAINSYDGSSTFFYATENSTIGDTGDHAVVYDFCTNGYVIAFEDLPKNGWDADYQDMVTQIDVLSCSARVACGNGVVDPGEQCDDGNAVNTDACTNACTMPRCGDGIIQNGESCDDGNAVNDDACSNICRLPVCGDGILQAGELCDDGNAVNTDACTNACRLPVCGDGILQAGEVCDDGNTANGDGCSAICRTEACGNGVVDAGEQCDDGNTNDLDACGNNCRLPICGDGVVQLIEQCELPGSNNNPVCSQTTMLCEPGGNRTGTRDAFGSCSLACGCQDDPFVYQCVAGQCGATCDEAGDVFVNGSVCHFGCSTAQCSFGSSCSLANYCGGALNATYYFNGACSPNGCLFEQQDCNSFDYYENATLFCSNATIRSNMKFHDFSCGIGGCAESVLFVNETLVENCNDRDGWYVTNSTRFVDDGACREREQRLQEYRDYGCSSPVCSYSVNDTRWVDTNSTRAKPDGTVCSDGLFCTVNDVCVTGACGGIPQICGGGDQCSVPWCDEELDRCSTQPLPVNTTCDDGLYCNGNDVCNGLGTCGNIGPVVSCSDENVCTFDVCNEQTDSCTYTSFDNETPTTTKTYGTPYYSNGTSEWITTQTLITLTAVDGLMCPSNLTTWHRVTLVDDVYCYRDDLCQHINGSGAWNSTVAFRISGQSCHLIEFYSNDSFGNAEHVRQQCAFVDTSGPVPNKTVGVPRELWNGTDAHFYNLTGRCWNGSSTSIDCWKVTTTTPITLACNDAQPHPVGAASVCFRVELDGDDATLDYCSRMDGTLNATGACCMQQSLVTLYFAEESEHNLAFTCVDRLGNVGPLDDEKFKVTGSGFTIYLNKKWNLISVPFVLLNATPDNVFGSLNASVVSVWSYDAFAREWRIYTPDGIANDDISSIEPGTGYWVLTRNATKLVIGGSLFSPAATPPMKPLAAGMNLIGYYGTQAGDGSSLFSYAGPAGNGKSARCALGSLVDTALGKIKWSSLVTYWEPANPNLWTFLGPSDLLDPGAGYWIEMATTELYAPSTSCPASGLPE